MLQVVEEHSFPGKDPNFEILLGNFRVNHVKVKLFLECCVVVLDSNHFDALLNSR